MATSSRYKMVCLGLLVAVLAAAGIAYRVYTTGAGYLLERGRSALERNDWNQADRCLELLEQRGYREPAHLLRGEVWLYKGRLAPETTVGDPQSASPAQQMFHLALGELAQIKEEGPLAVQGTVLGAECLARLGERPFAAEVLNAVVKRDPDHKEAHRWLAAIYIDLHSAHQAIAHLREWARLDPRSGRPYRWIGWFLSKDFAKHHKEAIEAYREACRRDLEPALRAEVVKELAETLVDGPADYQAALDTLDQCPETLVQPEMLTLRAQCLWSLAKQAEAIPLLESVLRANPELPQALQLRARMFLSDGQPKAALPLLETALRVDAHDHVSRQLAMEAYRQVGDNARAEQQRQLMEETRSIKDRLTELHDYAVRHPWDVKVRHQLAALCLKLNCQAEAHMWRRAASACASNQPSETTFEQSLSLQERN